MLGPLRSVASPARADERGARRAAQGAPGLTELRLEVPASSHWLERIGERPGLRVRLAACRPTGRNGQQLVQLLELSGSPRALEEAIAFLRGQPSLRHTVVGSSGGRSAAVWVVGRTPSVCRWLDRAGAVCETCRFLPDRADPDARSWTILRTSSAMPSRGDPVSLGPRSGVGRVRSVRPWQPRGQLTARQESALEAALRLGYYEVPRRGSLAEVASTLRVSRAAAGQLLRRGESRLIAAGLARAPRSR